MINFCHLLLYIVFCHFENNAIRMYIPLALTSVVYPKPVVAFISLINLVVSL